MRRPAERDDLKFARAICTASTTENGREILRKDDPNKQRVLQLPVYDNDHPERDLLNAGWPERWAAVKEAPVPMRSPAGRPMLQGWVADGKRRDRSI